MAAPCERCRPFLGDWRSHGPMFPHDAWQILESQEFPVGTHGGSVGMSGLARCRACGFRARFDCSYGPGYWFAADEA